VVCSRGVDRAEDPCLGEAEAREVGVHPVDAASLDEGVRGDVVGEGDRELHGVPERDRLDLQLLQDAPTRDSLARRRQRQRLGQVRLALRDELERGAAETDLDHRGGGKPLVRPQADLLTVLEADGVEADPPRERRLERGDPLGEGQIRPGREGDVVT